MTDSCLSANLVHTANLSPFVRNCTTAPHTWSESSPNDSPIKHNNYKKCNNFITLKDFQIYVVVQSSKQKEELFFSLKKNRHMCTNNFLSWVYHPLCAVRSCRWSLDFAAIAEKSGIVIIFFTKVTVNILKDYY